MDLETFLEGIRSCPDVEVDVKGEQQHMLTAEFGVYDNFYVLLNADFYIVIDDMKHGEKYEYGVDKKDRGTVLLRSTDGKTTLSITNRPDCSPQPWGCVQPPLSQEEQEHYDRQRKDYTMTVLFHPNYQKGPWDILAIRDAVDDVLKYAQEERLKACIPVIGWKYIFEGSHLDLSRVVYYDPETTRDGT